MCNSAIITPPPPTPPPFFHKQNAILCSLFPFYFILFLREGTRLRTIECSNEGAAQERFKKTPFSTSSLQDLTDVPEPVLELRRPELLDFSYNELSTFPFHSHTLAGLTSLSLKNNQFEHVPSVLAQLPHLNKLDMSYNFLNSVPLLLGCVTGLTTLSLSHNMIDSIAPIFSSLGRLQSLKLNYNDLSSLPVDLSKCTALTVLQVESNNIREVPSEYAALSALKELNLRSNRLSDLPSALAAGLLGIAQSHQFFLEENRFPRIFQERYETGIPSLFAYLSSFELSETERNALMVPGFEKSDEVAAAQGIQWKRGKELGAGAFGRVYLGLDARTGQLLAVKTIRIDMAASRDAMKKQVRDPWLKGFQKEDFGVNILGFRG